MGDFTKLRADYDALEKRILTELVPRIREQQKMLNDSLLELFNASGQIRVASERFITREIDEIDAEGGPAPRKRKSTALDTPADPELTQARTQAPAATAPKRTCSNCHKPGHRATTCPNPKPVVPMGKRACSNCRQPGHRATTCPN